MLNDYTYFHFNSIKIYNIDVNVIIKLVDLYISEKRKLVGHYIHAHILELSYLNEKLKKALQVSTINFPEGTGTWIASKYLLKGNSSRINFTDSSYPFIEHCRNKGYNVFLLGNTERIINKAVKNIQEKYSGLNIIGFQNGYDFQNNIIVDDINEKGTDVLLVGMGSPKQELWINENKDKLNCSVILSVGDLFTHWAGEKVRGPKVLRNIGLEWFFRAVSNPKNYFGRYFFGIPKFIYHLFQQKKNNP